jgi:hypothetical protein
MLNQGHQSSIQPARQIFFLFGYLPYAKIAAGFQSTTGQPQDSILAWKAGLVKGNFADIASIITLW